MTCRISRAALRHYADCAERGRVVVLDTETTGISRADEVVEIAAAEYLNGELARTLKLYVNPTCAIHPAAEAVHHLSRTFLAKHGLEPVEALNRFYDFLGAETLVVGHNIRFDCRMLQGECRKFNYEVDRRGFAYCDTIALARRLVPGLPHYRLGTLIEALNLDGRNSHDALDDALACGALFFNLVHRIPIVPEDYRYEPVFE